MAKRAEPYVPGEQIEQADLIKLNTNENPYPPSLKVKIAIAGRVKGKLHLYPSPTADELRQTIGSYYDLIEKKYLLEMDPMKCWHFLLWHFLNLVKQFDFLK